MNYYIKETREEYKGSSRAQEEGEFTIGAPQHFQRTPAPTKSLNWI